MTPNARCDEEHFDPLIAELCDQLMDEGLDPEQAHGAALLVFEEAVADGYRGPQ